MVPTTPQERLPLSPCHITGSTGLQQETGLPCWLTPTPCRNSPRNVPREGLAPPHTVQGDWYARASYDMLVVTLLQGQVQEAPFLQSSKCSSHVPQMVAPGVVQRQYCQPTPTRGLLQRPFKPLALGWCPVLCYSQRLLRRQEETFFPSCVFA